MSSQDQPKASKNAAQTHELDHPIAPWQNEAGDIGEEQLPAAQEMGEKTDKQVWNYAADKPAYGSRLGQAFRDRFKGQ